MIRGHSRSYPRRITAQLASPVTLASTRMNQQLGAQYAADQNQVDQLRVSAQIAAARTFGPFNDAPDSPFYSADDLSPTQTWEQIAERVVLATTVAAVHGAARRPITV